MDTQCCRITAARQSPYPPADLAIERIGDLLDCDFPVQACQGGRWGTGDDMNATQQLHDLGQSLWLDNITRALLTSGTLGRYIREFAVTGLTSNPTIFDLSLIHISEPTRLGMISYAVFCLKKKKTDIT